MTTRRSRIFYAATLLVVLAVHFITLAARAVGTWVPLANPAPDNVGMIILLSDGTVLAKNEDGNYLSDRWFRLSPNVHGSYANGTWSTNVPAMHDTRYAFASDVLQDGRVLIAGGEYGSGWPTSEIYDPVSNIWINVPVPTNLLNPALISPEASSDIQGFSDSISVTLPDGRVLIAPVAGSFYGQTMFFAPKSNVWLAGPTAIWQDFPQQDEASWLKLPDGSILTVDGGTTSTTERYISKLNAWISDANIPVLTIDPDAIEEGPALLLPNGKGIFFGATGHTAIYTPSGSTSPGSWVVGPDFPNGQGMPDAPGAMMVNGKILLATSPTPTADDHAPTPTSFYEYDYQSGPGGAFIQINAPTGGLTTNTYSQSFNMLDLPDGTVLLSAQNSQLYVYQPDGSPISAGKPIVSTIATNNDGSLHLTGTQFNGISQGASFGDENQMDSNYPLVRFTDPGGNVRYGRTYNWSSSGVQTGNTVVSTECTVPSGASLQDAIQVVANGIASDAVSLTNFPVVTTANDSGPGSLRQAVVQAAPGSLITFAAGLSGQTITLTSGQIVLSTNVTIDSSALANGIAINGNANSRIFQINSGANVVLNALTLTNANAQGEIGGGIYNGGNLTLNRCLVISNMTTVAGGGVYNVGTMTVNASTFANNSSASLFYYGGGIANNGTLSVYQSTFTGNSANGGGAIYSDGLLTVNQSTLSGNVAFCCGGAISLYASTGNQVLINSIVAGNSGIDLYNPFISFSSFSNNITGIDPQLAPLGNYGGAAPTMPPLPGSPVIDAGSDTAAAGFATDERGDSRLFGVHVDIGAVEFQTSAVETLPASGVVINFAMLNGTVNPGDDATAYYFQYGLTTNYGNVTATNFLPATNFTYTAANALAGLAPGTLYHFKLVTTNSLGTKAGADLTFHTFRTSSLVLNTSDAGDGSLREAIANTSPGGSIYFAGNLSGSTIALTSGQITISNDVTIDASTLANGISISGNSVSGIFHVSQGADVVMNTLTLTNGYNGGTGWSGYGGAINNSGKLAMNNCTLAGNSVVDSKLGGAIDSNNGGLLTLTGCTLYGNSSDLGGAINNRDTSVCLLQNTTIYGNAARTSWGGAIYNSYSASLSILQCTISGNNASTGGGIFNLFSELYFTNTIIAGNIGGDIYNYSGSTATAGGSNIVQSINGAGTTLGGDTILAVVPLLAPLANNGGSTLTLLPQNGSPAINAGVSSAAAGLTTDQRGLARLSGSAVDIGAVELQLILSGAPPQIAGLTKLGNGTFQFSFTNSTGANFRTFATTNAALPMSDWTMIGFAIESPTGSGQFQFTDSQATNYSRRFYRVQSP